MSLEKLGIEGDPTASDKKVEPDFDFEVGAFAKGAGQVTLRLLCDGSWFPKSPVEIYEALMDADSNVIGGGVPTGAMIAVAMEIMYSNAWWLDLQRVSELHEKCDTSRFIAEPSDVYEFEFDFGDHDPQSVMVYSMTQFPMTQRGLNSLTYLMSKMLLYTDLDTLEEFDRIIIARSEPDDAFFFQSQEWIVLSEGLFECDRTLQYGGKRYSKNKFLDLVAKSLAVDRKDPIKPQTAKISHYEGYHQAAPRPVWVRYDPTINSVQAS